MQVNTAVFEAFPVLKTKRLTLREIRPEDAAQIFAMRANGRVNRFITRPEMDSMEAAEELAESTIQAYQNRQAIGWAGILRENRQIIGTCGYNHIDFPNLRAEIGGELAVDYWGKHIAVEAVSAILQYGFEKMNLHTIEAKVSPENRGAVSLLEHLGFQKEAHFKDRIYYNGRFWDMAVHSLIRQH